MTGLWSALEDATAGAIDRVFHERALLTPLAASSPYGAAAADPARPAFEAMVGVEIRENRFASQGVAGHDGGSWDARVPSAIVMLHVSTVDVPQAASLRAGDLVSLLDRGGAHYRIARPDRGQRDRLTFVLEAV